LKGGGKGDINLTRGLQVDMNVLNDGFGGDYFERTAFEARPAVVADERPIGALDHSLN
jgi:hypothetical protein